MLRLGARQLPPRIEVLADADAEGFIPWDEATFFGRGAFDDRKLTAHGWGVTDLTLRPRPFASNPSKRQRKAGWVENASPRLLKK